MTRAALGFLIVMPSFGADQWVRMTTRNFELYTDAGEKRGREAILHFEQVRGFFVKASPVRPPADFPVRIIAFKTKEEFESYTPNPVAIAYFATSPKRDYIVMQDPSAEIYPVAIHEYMHLMIRHSGLQLPIWLNEGWADVYSTLRRVSDGVAVGDLIPGRIQTLAGAQWLDPDTLSSIDTQSPIYHEADRASLFYAQSWALVHMLYLSPEYRDNFGRFVMSLHRGNGFAQACQTALGRSPGQVFDDLKGYLDRKRIYGVVFKTSLGKSESQPEVSAVADFDSRLVLADLSAAVGQLDAAKEEYGELGKKRPGQPALMQSLGFLELQSHDNQAARQDFEKAFAAGENDPRMCFVLAMLERDAKQPPDRIVPPLERAVQSKPDYTDALLQLGLMKVAARDFDVGINRLMSISDVTPDHAPALFLALAYAHLETGDVERARNNVENARKWARKLPETQEADRLAGLIEARSTGPFAAHPGEKVNRAEGVLQALDCSTDESRLRILVGKKVITLALPQPKAVEYSHQGGGTLQLRCGPQKPIPIAVEYVPASVVAQTTAGVIRRVAY